MIRIGSLIPIGLSLIILSASMVADLRAGRIPNRWICAGLAAGLLFRILSWTSFGWTWFFLGMAIPLLICWVPFCMGAMGAGDVKLLLVLGALNGGQHVLFCIFFSFLFAAGISLVRLLRLRQLRAGLTHLFLYFQGVFSRGTVGSYGGRYVEGHTIHFAVSIFLGYLAWLGVNLCRNML